MSFLFCSLFGVDFWFNKEFGKVEIVFVDWLGEILGRLGVG